MHRTTLNDGPRRRIPSSSPSLAIPCSSLSMWPSTTRKRVHRHRVRGSSGLYNTQRDHRSPQAPVPFHRLHHPDHTPLTLQCNSNYAPLSCFSRARARATLCRSPFCQARRHQHPAAQAQNAYHCKRDLQPRRRSQGGWQSRRVRPVSSLL